MWLLPTRGRPELAQQCLYACMRTRMSAFGIVAACETEPGQYDNLRLPRNWALMKSDLDLQPVKNMILELFPNEKVYGLVCDDLVPHTKYWDVLMEEAAGRWNLIDCNDQWIVDPKTPYDRKLSLCGAFCWGGELVRTVGWWGFPDVRQAGNDDAWVELCIKNLNLRRHLDYVIIEHQNWRTEKRPKDDTDNWVRDGVEYIKADFQIFHNWRISEEPKLIANKIKAAMEQDSV